MEQDLPFHDPVIRFLGNSLRVALMVPVVLALGPCPPLSGQDATTAGEVTTPHPTIINLAVEWRIKGDDNFNSEVTVKCRRVEEKVCHEAMPLRRVPAGTSAGRTRPTFLWDTKHSGSIFYLRPSTEYEIWLKLDEPDGGPAEMFSVIMKT